MNALWREQARQNKIRDKGGELVLTAEDPANLQQYPVELIDRVYSIWAMSDFNGLPPHPFEVLAYPSDFLDVLFKWHEGVRFWEDFDKRPAYLQE